MDITINIDWQMFFDGLIIAVMSAFSIFKWKLHKRVQKIEKNAQ